MRRVPLAAGGDGGYEIAVLTSHDALPQGVLSTADELATRFIESGCVKPVAGWLFLASATARTRALLDRADGEV